MRATRDLALLLGGGHVFSLQRRLHSRLRRRRHLRQHQSPGSLCRGYKT